METVFFEPLKPRETRRPPGGFQEATGGPRRQAQWYAHAESGALVKPHFCTQNRAPACTGAIFRNPAETHPAEGMTKVIPALSCKHDNEERRSGSDDYLARRQLLRQRGGFNRFAHSAGPCVEETRRRHGSDEDTRRL